MYYEGLDGEAEWGWRLGWGEDVERSLLGRFYNEMMVMAWLSHRY